MTGQQDKHRQLQVMPSNVKTRHGLSVAVMGLDRVGKSSIINHLVKTYKFKARNDAKSKETQDDSICVCDLVLNFCECDCSMTQDATIMETPEMVSASLFILVFAVDRIDSYEYVEQLKDAIKELKGGDVGMVVVGNKHDITQREVRFALTDCVVSMDWELPYVEVSTKTGYNLNRILPYLFRHESLGRYRHLFEDKETLSQNPRRKSTGSLNCVFKTPTEYEGKKRRVLSVFSKRHLRSTSRTDTVETLQERTQRRGSSTPRRVSLVNIFMCNEQDAMGDTTPDVSENSRKKRSQSITVISEKPCTTNMNAPTSRMVRRMSAAVHNELSDKHMAIDYIGSRKHGSWLKTIRKHFMK